MKTVIFMVLHTTTFSHMPRHILNFSFESKHRTS